MLRSEVKEGLLLVVFAFLMHEFLTAVTIGFTIAGVLSVISNYRPGKITRNILALLILVSYWFSYGNFINPEVGLNFLTTVIVLKLLEKESVRDQYMTFFGLLLLISTGSLFERTLTYMLFFTTSFIILLYDFYKNQSLSSKPKDFGMLFFWILPLTFLLFLFVPRSMNPIPFRSSPSGPGEIGYTTDVNFASLTELTANDSPAFHVLVEKQLNQGELYWRGNTISQSDGWNWVLISEDRPNKFSNFEYTRSNQDINQTIRLFNKEKYLFSLDSPVKFSIREESIIPAGSRTILQNHREWIRSYEVLSRPGESFTNEEDVTPYLRIGLPQADRQWIRDNFKGEDTRELEKEIKKYFYSNGFTYSLRPGLVNSFKDFMQNKKIGLCSHFASAVALIMRTKNVPARLVSGYMGGNYNPFGRFYLVSQNDAHVWIEVLQKGQWTRIDPTEWIAPDRVKLGGEAFMSTASTGIFSRISIPGWNMFSDLKLWFNQWDFRFYNWLEQVDYHGQDAWMARLNFKRKWFYTIAPILLFFFLLIYAWQLRNRKKHASLSELDKFWAHFLKKLRKRGIALPLGSVKEGQYYLENLVHPDSECILELWKKLIEYSFAEEVSRENLGKKIKRL